jgi:hypothetical protein
MNRLRTISSTLPLDFIRDVKNFVRTQRVVRTNHTTWGEPALPADVANIIGFSGPMYMVELVDALKEQAMKHMAVHFTDINLLDYEADITYVTGGRYSFAPWHNDVIYERSITVYLNEEWDRNWGGCYLYDEDNGEGVRAIYPEFNKAIDITPPLLHATAMPNIQAPLRFSLQYHIFKKGLSTNPFDYKG